MTEPFPDRRPAFMRAPIPPFDPHQKLALEHFVEPPPVPVQRWSWWAVEHFDGKHPKIVVCLHVMHGRDEYEARYDVLMRYYHEKKVMVVRKPVTEHDFREVRMGIWNEIADKMETWPELERIVANLTAYVHDKHDLSSAQSPEESK